jgi:enoyl-CoA hydratase/carnithine racemase
VAERYSTITVARDRALRGLVTVTLDRPEKLNAIDFRMHQELQRAFGALRDDGDARVVILTGAGRAFSSGNALPATGAQDPVESSWITAALFGAAIALGLGAALTLRRRRR